MRSTRLLLPVVGCLPGLLACAPVVSAQAITPKTAVLTVDFSQELGRVRALNGANLGPPLAVQASGMDLNAPYKALKIPFARLHDVPLDNPGMRLVDIQHVFGNWDADETDPKNYYFEQTDDYIRNCRELGTDIIYRLGTSIEHSVNRYYAHPPKDYGKWTRICLNIIRHYNEGWADGHHWNIRYWEIWNEPNVRRMMWTGGNEDYFRLYVMAASRIKREFPDLKVGGPALGGLNEEFIAPFLKYCREHDAPLDFLSWHYYGADLGEITAQPSRARKWLDLQGFDKTELHLNEWHYFPADFGKLFRDPHYARDVFDGPDGCNGIDAAAYIPAVLTAWQDTPLTMGNYYTASTIWGFGLFHVTYAIPYKTYHGFRAFSAMLDHPIRVRTGCDDKTIRVLAGRNAEGAKAILISAFKSEVTRIQLNVTHVDGTGLKVLKLDRENDMVAIAAEYKAGTILLGKQAGSAVLLITLR